MERFIGIDPSLTSTAVCILDGDGERLRVFTDAKLDGKWMRLAEGFVDLCQVTYKKGKRAYSESEVDKLVDYRANAYSVVDSLGLGPGDRVFMEGYAARAKGNIVDLVVFGTFIRERVLDAGADLTVVTPMSLKKSWAEAIYPKDAKGIARNYDLRPNKKGEMLGVAGGSFKKQEMLRGLLDLQEDSGFRTEIGVLAPDMLLLKDIPKPFDDCVDAYAAAYLGRSGAFGR